MALSFGKGKKGDAAPNAASGGAGEEALDESWFETAFEEEGNAPAAPAAAAPASPPMATDAEPDFDIFAELDSPPRGPASSPMTAAFDLPEAAPPAATPFAGVPFDTSDPAGEMPLPHAPFAEPDATPFDAAAPEATAKPKGGLKKLLPVLGLLIVVGGGAFFWYSQQVGGTDATEGEVSLSPSTSQAPPGAATQPGAQPGAAPGAMPPSMPPGGAPGGAKPAPGKPAPGKPAPGKPVAAATPESRIMHDIGKLWFEGANAKHAGKKALALKKWRAAIKLARSKPGHETSAKMIQEAIDKYK